MASLRTFQDEINEIQIREAAKQRVHATSDRERPKDPKDKHKPAQPVNTQTNHIVEDRGEVITDTEDTLQVGIPVVSSIDVSA